MFRLPSWISESRGCDKVENGEADMKTTTYATHPVVEILQGDSGGFSKRKRSDSSESAREGTLEVRRTKASPSSHDKMFTRDDPKIKVEPDIAQRSMVKPSRADVQSSIEGVISLEILTKHKELQLINQELAKCQTALDQLRRCHLIPYPVSQNTPESMVNISTGSGPAVGYGDNVPQWAPAYGVADGPYSRHYAKWLIPDPNFDGVQVESSLLASGGPFEGTRAGKTVGRSTRHSIAEGIPLATAPRSQRGSKGHQPLEALPSGYAQAKEKDGIATLQRRKDNQLVKLVCQGIAKKTGEPCNRSNFASVQGFINHCRIGHNIDYKSHEDAAVACGVPINAEEIESAVASEEKVAPLSNGLVHRKVLEEFASKEDYASVLARVNKSINESRYQLNNGATTIPNRLDTTPARSDPGFVPSPSTPYLSNLMRSQGSGINLDEFVGEARMRVNLDESESEESDDESETSSISPGFGGLDGAHDSHLPVMRMPVRAGVSPGPLNRPSSSKGHSSLSGTAPRILYATPASNTAFGLKGIPDIPSSGDHTTDVDMMDGLSFNDLSPNTVASNNAPSLVDDDSEYGADDMHSIMSADDAEDSDVAEIDIEDGSDDKVVPGQVLRNRKGSRSGKEEKHVTFVSPVKGAGRDRRRNHS